MEPSQSSPPGIGQAPPAVGPEPGKPPVSRPAAPAAVPPRRLGPIPLDRRAAGVAAACLVLLASVVFAGTGYHYEPFVDAHAAPSDRVPSDDRGLQQLTSRLRARERDLTGRLRAAAPRGVYIVIDQTQNRLYLKRDDETLLEAVCSAGSGMVLRESGGKKRQWVFDSPRGRFEVRSMSRNPVWRKPDWAFVEESEPIPRNPAERLDYGSLGEYALYFGDGFMIHGTLYERLLGRAVSHGCIRVGREDLRKVWANAKLGTQIYIY
jgi:L,D-transpeptidase YbiS